MIFSVSRSSRFDGMSAEQESVDVDSLIPQTYASKAEAFAKCLQDKLMSLGGATGFGGSTEESCACSVLVNSDRPGGGESLDDMVNYEVPYRILRESSSTSNLEKHFSNNLYITKRISKSGESLTDRTSDEDCGLREEVPVPAIKVTAVEELETDPQVKLRRCSSLKTWKTPPGTPGEKKMVRFADALGLDLADIRTFLDEIPRIPNSAFENLNYSDFAAMPPPPPLLTLVPKFVQPDSQLDFLDRVEHGYVSLERALVTDVAVLTVSGSIRVRNIAYEKEVHVRYTKDSWTTFSDLQASYIMNSCDEFSDRFSFVLYGHTLKIGGRLEFAIRLDCCGLQFWDNNFGKNYVFECLPQSPSTSQFADVPLSTTDTCSAFY